MTTAHDLGRPHHDGSGLYVSDPDPGLGDTVTVFVRAPLGAGVCSMWLRSAPDGEAQYVEAVIDRRTEDEGWWRADLIIHNQDTNYRVLLDGGRSPIGG